MFVSSYIAYTRYMSYMWCMKAFRAIDTPNLTLAIYTLCEARELYMVYEIFRAVDTPNLTLAIYTLYDAAHEL